MDLRPKRLMFVLGSVWGCLVVAYGLTQYYFVRLHHEDTRYLARFFDLDGKANVPQSFQALGLLAISFLLLGIAKHKSTARDPLAIYWKSLGWVFLFLTLDAICGIHNQTHVFNAKSYDEQRRQGVFFFSWVLAYAAIMLPAGLWYLRFLMKLPRALASDIVVAGIIFVSGAMGMEMIYGWFRSHYEHVRLSTTIILTTMEESMETLGEMLMIYTLLRHMALERIRVTMSAVEEAPLELRLPQTPRLLATGQRV